MTNARSTNSMQTYISGHIRLGGVHRVLLCTIFIAIDVNGATLLYDLRRVGVERQVHADSTRDAHNVLGHTSGAGVGGLRGHLSLQANPA